MVSGHVTLHGTEAVITGPVSLHSQSTSQGLKVTNDWLSECPGQDIQGNTNSQNNNII